MKRITVGLILGLVLGFTTFSWAHQSSRSFNLENYELNFRQQTLVLTPHFKGPVIKIDQNFCLFIDDQPVELTRQEQQLVKLYYQQAQTLINEAKKLGLESGKFAICEVAPFTAKVVLSLVFQLLGDETAKKSLKGAQTAIEEKAEQLEKQGARLEKIAKKLEKLHYRLFTEVKVLNRMGCRP